MAIRSFDEALALWRGPALADLADQRSLSAEAARLDELRLEAQSVRLEGLLAAGLAARAVGDLEALLTGHALSENLWALLMLAYYREGRQGDALGCFHRARRILADELGIDPSPDLVRLHERILQQDPSLELRGEPLRGYRLLEKLEDGIVGVIYRAIQPKVDRDVAVKIFHEHVAGDAGFARRFEHQAQAVASLEHPHVAPVYDYWREPGRAYIVSRYLKGGTLQAHRDRGAAPDQQAAVRIVDQVASALGAAHRRGIVHGDVSPANVRFDGEGNAYLVDFAVGVVERGDERADLRRLASLATTLLPANDRLRELAGRLETSDPVTADAFAAAATGQPVGTGTGASRADARNPYKGLRAFMEGDALDFFGRGELNHRLIQRLSENGRDARFLAVVGPSGSGKSSVVRAALVPEIRRGALDPSETNFVADMMPGGHPIDELEGALQRVAVRSVSRLHDMLDAGSRGLLDAVDAVLPPKAQLTLIVDQFEEAFTLTEDEAEREAFLEALRVAAVDPDSRVRIVLTMRADFYDRPLVYPRFGEIFAARTEAVAPLTPDELEEAIRRPAEAVGVSVEPGLVAEMIADVAHQPGALPLVQYALTETFERRNDERLTLSTYRRIGGISGALSARADRIFDASTADAKRATKQVFLRLVSLGEGQQDTRRRAVRSELDALEAGAGTIDEVLDAFGRHRLLTFDREPATREPTVEIAHEALLSAWQRLRGWIDGAREDLRQERSVARAAAEWRASDRDPSFLMRGVRLEQVATWAEATDLAIGTPERAYLKASLDERNKERLEQEERAVREVRLERRSRFRLRALVAVLAISTAVATLLTLFALGQEQKATREASLARVRELAAAALAERELDPERSILLALEAVKQARGETSEAALAEAVDALHRAVAASRVTTTIRDTGDEVAWSAAGLIVSLPVAKAGVVDLRDGATGAIVRSIDAHQGAVTDLASDSSGRRLATAGDDGWVRVWDPASGQLLASANGNGFADSLTFSQDASRLVATWPDSGIVRLIDTNTGQIVWERTGELAALSPDASQLGFWGTGQVSVVDILSEREAFEPLARTPYDASMPRWSPDGRWIATVGIDGLDIWDASNGAHLHHRRGHASGLGEVAWSHDSSRLATGTDETGDVIVWRLEGDGPVELLTLSSDPTRSGVADLAFSADGTRLMAASAHEQTIKVWDLTLNGEAEWAAWPSTGYFGDAAFMPDSQGVVAADADGFVRIHDIVTGIVSGPVGSRVYEHAFDVSPDGRLIAYPGQTDANGDLVDQVLDLTTGERRFDIGVPAGWDGVNWSSDSRFLAANGTPGTGVTVLDLDGRVVATLPERDGYETWSARFTPDGERLVSVASREASENAPEAGRITVWDWWTQSVIRTIETPASKDLDIDVTGRRAATGFDAPPVIWNLETGARMDLEGIESSGEVAFSPDGTLLGVVSETSVQLFDSATGAQRLVLRGSGSRLIRLAFSADGKKLAVHGLDGARVWALDLDDLIAIAQRELTRTWTEDECQRFLHLEQCPDQ